MASASAASSISSPRAVLMMRTPFLHFANRSALKRCLVDGSAGTMKRDVVGARAQIVERDELHAKRRRHFCRDERVVGDHLHLERVRACRDFLSDPAKTDESEGL